MFLNVIQQWAKVGLQLCIRNISFLYYLLIITLFICITTVNLLLATLYNILFFLVDMVCTLFGDF